MKIALIFPYNNPVTLHNPKPVVLAALSYIQNTKFPLTIITPFANDIIKHQKHQIIAIESTSKSQYFHRVIATLDNSYDIVEVHQNTQLAASIAKKYPHIKVTLIKHGFYLINRIKEKFFIYRLFYYHCYLKHINRVFCISKYVCTVLEGMYPKYYSFNILYNSYGHVPLNDLQQEVVKRKQQIVFSGKPVDNKGINELFEALDILLNKYPTYSALVMSAFFSKKVKYRKTIDKILQKPSVQQLIKEKRIILQENLSIKEVFTNLLQSEIALMLTKAAEPFGLSCLEYHLAACAVVSSGRGGLKEINGDCAMFLNHVIPLEIVKQVSYLIDNSTYREQLAITGKQHVLDNFDPVKLSNFLDAEREKTYGLQCED